MKPVLKGNLPLCAPGEVAEASIEFPDCWDGRRLDSPDHQAHMTYSVNRDAGGVLIDLLSEARGRLNDVLAAIQHDEHLLLPQMVDQVRGRVRIDRDAQQRRERAWHKRRIA